MFDSAGYSISNIQVHNRTAHKYKQTVPPTCNKCLKDQPSKLWSQKAIYYVKQLDKGQVYNLFDLHVFGFIP